MRYLVIICFLVVGCSPQYHFKQFQKKGGKIECVNDTVYLVGDIPMIKPVLNINYESNLDKRLKYREKRLQIMQDKKTERVYAKQQNKTERTIARQDSKVVKQQNKTERTHIRNNATTQPKWKQVLTTIGIVVICIISFVIGLFIGYFTSKIPLGR